MTDNNFLATPPGDCCTKGTLHEGQHLGKIETIASLETYIVHPPEGTRANGNIVLYFPDVWGFFNNAFLVMDAFARAGYLTLGLDYFRGDPVWLHRRDRLGTELEPGFDFGAWMDRHMEFAVEATPRWVAAVKERFGGGSSNGGTRAKFACVGYCFGAPLVCDALAGDVCAVGAFAHPAFVQEHHIRNLKSEWSSKT